MIVQLTPALRSRATLGGDLDVEAMPATHQEHELRLALLVGDGRA